MNANSLIETVKLVSNTVHHCVSKQADQQSPDSTDSKKTVDILKIVDSMVRTEEEEEEFLQKQQASFIGNVLSSHSPTHAFIVVDDTVISVCCSLQFIWSAG